MAKLNDINNNGDINNNISINITNGGSNTGSFSGSFTGSHAGGYSGSFSGSFTGSYTGSFVGDGTGLSGVTAKWDGNYSGSASITGSLNITGSFNLSGSLRSTVDWVAVFPSKASITGSIDITGDLKISGSLNTSGSTKLGYLTSNTHQISGSVNVVSTSDNPIKWNNIALINESQTGSFINISLTNPTLIGSSISSGSIIVTGSLLMNPTGTLVLPLTASINPPSGSIFYSSSFLWVWNGSRYMSGSLA